MTGNTPPEVGQSAGGRAVPPVVCRPLLEVKVKLTTTTRTREHETSFWLKGLRGQRLEGVCPWCSRTSLMALSDVQENAQFRCWHCRQPSDSLKMLNAAHPGLLRAMTAPAVDEILDEVRRMFKRLSR